MTAFRVQGRNTGEPWRTLTKHDSLTEALTYATQRAAATITYGDMTLPVWGYLRIVQGARVCVERTPRDAAVGRPWEVRAS